MKLKYMCSKFLCFDLLHNELLCIQTILMNFFCFLTVCYFLLVLLKMETPLVPLLKISKIEKF